MTETAKTEAKCEMCQETYPKDEVYKGKCSECRDNLWADRNDVW